MSQNMSVWKSPVFYFGNLLVILVVVLLVLPFAVPWDAYKPDLAAYGRKLTGREVAIDGKVAVRLFPWPRLEAEQVSIGNPPGVAGPPLLMAERMVVRLQLAGLFSGTLDVDSIDVESPQLNLVRTADGRVNWMLAPDEDVRGGGLLSRVKLDQITLHNGRVAVHDGAQQFQGGLTEVEATLSADRIEGPWRLRGTGAYGDTGVDLSLSSSTYEADKPFRFGVRMTPQDVAWPGFVLDGAWDGKAFKGDVRVEPQTAAPGQKATAANAGQLKPLALQAAVDGNFNRIVIDKIRITPADARDSGTLIEGHAQVDLIGRPQARVLLKAPRVNLDTLLGADSLAAWRAGGVLALTNTLLASTPQTLSAEVSLDVSTLTLAGDAVNNVQLAGTLEREALRIRSLRAELPGRSEMLFDGIVFPGKDMAELGGNLAFESNDTRAFLAWAQPAWKDGLEAAWKGSRGRTKFQSAVNWTAAQFALNSMSYEFEGESGTAALEALLGPSPRLTLQVQGTALDVDNLVPRGASLASEDGVSGLAGVAVALLEGSGTWERHVDVSFGRLTLNGVSAQDVALDYVSSVSGFELRKLSIGSVEGARISGNGLVLLQDDGPSGDVKLTAKADDPRGFLQLIGVVDDARQRGWTAALGASAADLAISAATRDGAPALNYTLSAKSGAYALELNGTAANLERPDTAQASLNGTLTASDGAQLLSFIGVDPQVQDGAPGTLRFALDGSLQEAFKGTVALDALKATVEFSGSLDPRRSYGGLDGRFEAKAPDVAVLQRIVGLPLPADRLGGALNLFGQLAARDDGGLSITQLGGEFAGKSLSGDVSIGATGQVSADLAFERLSLADVAALAVLPWEGQASGLAASFPTSSAVPLRGEIFLRPEHLDFGFAPEAQDAVIGLSLQDGRRVFTIQAPGDPGQKFELSLDERQGEAMTLAGKGRIAVDLGSVMKGADGTVLASGLARFDGAVTATGRTLASALSSLDGKGTYWLSGVGLPRLTLDNFARRIAAVDKPEALTAALTQLEQGPGTDLGQRTGSFTINSGALSLAPVEPAGEGVRVVVQPGADLTLPQVTLDISVAQPQRPDLPPVSLTYAGAPGALQVRSGTSALASKLGYDLLAKDMAALEALKQEQEKLAAKEEEQRQADAARFQVYQDKRVELRTRQRERRIWAADRQRRADALAAQLATLVKNGDAATRIDLVRRVRERRVWPRLRASEVPPQP